MCSSFVVALSYVLLTLFGHICMADQLLPALQVNDDFKIRFAADKGWSEWSKWSECTSVNSKACLSGAEKRHRSCKKSHFCSGVYVESRDCPTEFCSDIRKPTVIFSDVALASYASFISQECDTDIKYALNTARAKSIPPSIKTRFKTLSHKFSDGYYNRKFLMGNPETKLRNMTKYCFEPYEMSPNQAMHLSYFNRTSRSSLYPERKITYSGFKYISGIALVVDNKQNLVAAYFAVPSSSLGYRKVYYRRWKGMGFEDSI